MTNVPRFTTHPNGRVTYLLPDGRPACTKCRRRPRVPGQRWCQPCRTEYSWQRRRGMIEVLLYPWEWETVKKTRIWIERQLAEETGRRARV